MPVVTVRLFARIRELANADTVAVPFGAQLTVADLRRELVANLPAAAELIKRSAIAVNSDYAADDRVLSEKDDVAIIPPVSGGQAGPR